MASTTKTVTYDDIDFTIPAAEDWSLDAIEAYEDGKIATLIREILGAEQWARFKEKPRTVSDLQGFMQAFEKATDSGN